MRAYQSIFVAGVLALMTVVDTSSQTLAAQIATPGAVSPLAAQHQLRVRFHRLRLATIKTHDGLERGLWLRGPLLTGDQARRTALVGFLRTELIPYIANQRTVVYPVVNAIIGGSSDLTAAANSDGRVIEGLVDRLDTATRHARFQAFRDHSETLSIVVENYFAKDRALIERILALRPQIETRGVVLARMQ